MGSPTGRDNHSVQIIATEHVTVVCVAFWTIVMRLAYVINRLFDSVGLDVADRSDADVFHARNQISQSRSASA